MTELLWNGFDLIRSNLFILIYKCIRRLVNTNHPLKMASMENSPWQFRIEKDDQYRRELSTLCKQLRAEAISSIEYFQDKRGINNERFYVSFVHLYDHLDSGIEPGLDELTRVVYQYDFDPSLPANGYRSIIKVIQKCCYKLLLLTRYISTNRESFLFRGGHYSKELDAYVSTLGQLRACLYYIEQLLHYSPDGELFPDEAVLTEEQYERAEQLMGEVEALSQETFYGRCLGFQFCDSLNKPLTTIVLALASFGDGYDQPTSVMKIASSVLGGGKYFLDPDSRAQQVVNVTRNGDIRFCKAFWSLAENQLMHNLPLFVCPPVSVDRVIVLEPEPFDLPLEDESDVARINPPCAHSGPGPVYTRLLSAVHRHGQEVWRGVAPKPSERGGSSATLTSPAVHPASPGLVIQIHGGGFVAQSSASHEVYLRHWAKQLQVPVFCFDYSLAPEDPFPRQLEEVFFAYCWALKNCQLLGSTAERICLVGDSAGANLCVAVAFRAISAGIRVPDGILSVYGSMLVKYTPSPSRILSLMDPLLPIGILSKCLAAYAGIGPISTTPVTPVADGHQNPTCDLKKAEQQETTHPTVGEGDVISLNGNSSVERDSREGSYTLEEKSCDLTADLQDAMQEPEGKPEENSKSGPHEDSASVTDGDGLAGIHSWASVCSSQTDGVQSITSLDSAVLGQTEPPRADTEPNTADTEPNGAETPSLPTHTPSCDSGFQDKVLSNDSLNGDRGATKPTDNNDIVKSGFNLDFNKVRHRKKADGVLLRSPSSPSLTSLQQKIQAQSPLTPTSPYLGSDGVLSATTPTYAKIRHFAQSPVQHFKHLPISKNPYMSPYLGKPDLLQGLCPMYFVVSHLDPLLDDSIQFAKKLRDLGNEVYIDLLDDLPHGFLNFVPVSAEAKAASDLCVHRLRDILGLNKLTDEEWEVIGADLAAGEMDDLLDEVDDLTLDHNGF